MLDFDFVLQGCSSAVSIQLHLIIAVLGHILYMRELIPETIAVILKKKERSRLEKRFINQLLELKAELTDVLSTSGSTLRTVRLLLGSVVLCPREGVLLKSVYDMSMKLI